MGEGIGEGFIPIPPTSVASAPSLLNVQAQPCQGAKCKTVFPDPCHSSVLPIGSGGLKNLGRVRPPSQIFRYSQGNSNLNLSGIQAKGKGVNTLPINKGES